MAGIKRRAKKTFRYLRERGARETVRAAASHLERKRAERRFLQAAAPSEEELARQREAVFSEPLTFSIAVPLYNTPEELLREMIASVQAQTWADWELCLADGSDKEHAYVGEICGQLAGEDPRIRYQKLERNGGISENSNACLAMARGEYIALLDHDDLLTPDALYQVRDAIEKTHADFLYSDELIFRSPNRNSVIGIRMKPGFSPDSLLTNNYICHLTVFHRDLLARAGGFRAAYDGSQDHDLVLRLTSRARGIAHIARVLYLWRSIPTSVASDINSKRYAIEAGRSAVENYLRAERGLSAAVESTAVFPTMYRVRYPIEGQPTVRVILDATGEREAVERKLQELKKRAGWDCAWELLGEEAAGRPRRDRWADAAARAAEEYLLFLDGLPDAAEEGWLRELLSLAAQPHIGAAAPQIRFRNGDIRMAGIVLGMGAEGVAGRLNFCGDGEEDAAFFGQLAVVEDVSAVADCLLLSREKYLQAGGFAPEYRDTLFEADLCLRLLEKGYYNVCTPHARLRMGESKAFRFDLGRECASWPEDAAVFRRRNARALRRGDGFYNANLSLRYENWHIRDPRREKGSGNDIEKKEG